MNNDENKLPRWDMSVVFPGLESAEFEAGFEAAKAAVDNLAALFDEHDVGAKDGLVVDDAVVAAFETVVGRYDAVHEDVYATMRLYIQSFVHTDSRNEAAKAKASELRPYLGRLSFLRKRLDAWLASMDGEELLAKSAVARDHEFMVSKAKEMAAYQMSAAEEGLAAEMSQTGSAAWKSLWETVTSQLMVAVEVEGEMKTMSMSDARKLAYDADRELRRRAYEAELAVWEESAVPLTAALNGVKGEQVLLAKRRGWESPLDAALAANNIDRETLEALMTALEESFEDFGRYLKAKARVLGVPVLAWYDLFAPVGKGGEAWPFDRAARFIVEQFEEYSPKMAGLARRAFDKRWIEAEPRPGKVDISYCGRLRGDESRILVNFKPTFYEVTVLAHELGHAYHNLNLAGQTVLGRETPVTLAETASTFCQTLVQDGGLKQAGTREKVAILDASLQLMTLTAVEAITWFLFEKSVTKRREKGELSLAEIKEIMLDVQRQCYGDALDPELLHPFSWAAWPHQFWFSFYNFQYAFGNFFALGLYRRFQEAPEGFQAQYDGLLASTAMATPAELAARFGMDIRSADFWRSSLDVIRADIDRFEMAVNQ